jgi:hypothetical protein
MTETEWLSYSNLRGKFNFLQANKINRTKVGRRKLRLFGCACAQRVSHLMSERGRLWLYQGQQCAEGLLTEQERRHVDSQDIAPFNELIPAGVDLESTRMQRSADVAGWYTLATNVMTVATVSAHNAAMAIGIRGVLSGRSAVEHAAEVKEQTALLHHIFSNPYRPPISVNHNWLLWNDGTVVKIARSIYDDRAFDRMPILADALEDAGCDNADLLSHCRSGGEHVRGCWAVDLLLGKS